MTKHVENFWLDLVPEIKLPILDNAVEYGWLKKEFVEDIKQLENEGGKDGISKRSVGIGCAGTKVGR